MIVHFSIKQFGKRKPVIEALPIEIAGLTDTETLESFLQKVVLQQITSFNQRMENPKLVNFLLPESLNHMANAGKVSFGDQYNQQTVSAEKAQETALLAFKDGLFSVFIDDEEQDNLQAPVFITETSRVTFIRLTFLAGGYF